MTAFVSEIVVGKKIGSGHFGDVHLATDPVHGEVAVKIISQEPTESDGVWGHRKAGFLAEAQKPCVGGT